MAPVQSKPSEMVKKFMVPYEAPDGSIGRIEISSHQVRDVLRRLAITFQAKGNIALKDGALYLGAVNLINAALDGMVDQRHALPITGRGDGRDTVDKSFYLGNGDKELKPEMFVLRDGVYFCSHAMYLASLALVEKAYDAKVASSKKDDVITKDNVIAMPATVCVGSKKAKLNDGATVITKVDNDADVSSDIGSDGDSKLPALPFGTDVDDVTKAAIMDTFVPGLAGADIPVEAKAKMFNVYVDGTKSKE